MKSTTLSPIVNGLVAVLLDVLFVATCSTLLWLNAGWTVMDVPVIVLATTLLVGALLFGFRHLTSLRRRFGPAHPSAIRAEWIAVPTQIALLAGAVVAWKTTGDYQFGWSACFAAIAMLVGNTLLLMIDVTTRTVWREPSRQLHLHVRRFASVEALHIAAGLAGIAGIVVTVPIHEWKSTILNAAVLLDAAMIGAGCALALFLGWTLGRLVAGRERVADA